MPVRAVAVSARTAERTTNENAIRGFSGAGRLIDGRAPGAVPSFLHRVTDDPVIEMRRITKRFGSALANDDVDFNLKRGELHALLGENGAGKTTLMHVLFGLLAPDSGVIRVEGEEVHFDSPRDAIATGIGMVHQHFMLIPQLTVAENIVLGARPGRSILFSKSNTERRIQEFSEECHIDLPANRVVGDLPVEMQQRVEILRLLYRGAQILIMDEPTAVLSHAATSQLFEILLQLKRGGRTIVLITHKLSEVTSSADRATVLRQGRVALSASRTEFDTNRLAVAMIGTELPPRPARSPKIAPGEVLALMVSGLDIFDDRGRTAVAAVSLSVRAGEIVGLVGVEGNGQTELCQALSGLRRPTAGRIEVDGVDVAGAGPDEFYEAGVSVVTEDRLRWDLISDLSVAENLTLSQIRQGRFSHWGLLNRSRIRLIARPLLVDYDVRPPQPTLTAAALSGGNQQKVVLAREFSRNPRVLVASQPTRGLDMGAADLVLRRILVLAESGCAVLFNSADLDELFAISDRLLVIFRGQIVLNGTPDELDVRSIAHAMTTGEIKAGEL
jgi:simple sugar transport system ATP-binding protein